MHTTIQASDEAKVTPINTQAAYYANALYRSKLFFTKLSLNLLRIQNSTWWGHLFDEILYNILMQII